jgi:thioredoxin 1
MSRVAIVDEQTFEGVRRASGPVLLDFYADWCGPCRALAPALERFAESHSDVDVRKINVDENPRIAQEFGIRGIPTLVVLRNGRETGRTIGGVGEAEIERLVTGA